MIVPTSASAERIKGDSRAGVWRTPQCWLFVAEDCAGGGLFPGQTLTAQRAGCPASFSISFLDVCLTQRETPLGEF